MTKINKKLERIFGVINMFKLTLLKTDDTIEEHHFKHEPTFQDMYPLIKCSLIEISGGYDENISERSFDIFFNEEGGPLCIGYYDEKDNPNGAKLNKRATKYWFQWLKKENRVCLPNSAIFGNCAYYQKEPLVAKSVTELDNGLMKIKIKEEKC